MIKSSYQLFRVIGIPVRAHISLIIALILFALPAGLPGILFALGLFSSVALHELGHSWVAIKKGSHVHEILLLPFGGVAKISNAPALPRDELHIAAAGPAVSALLAFIFYMLTSLEMSPLMSYLVSILHRANVMLCLFNLLPAFPMDGGRIFRAFMTPRIGKLKATALAVRIGRIIAVAGGIYGLVYGPMTLIMIAVYIYYCAGAECRAQFGQAAARNPWERRPEQGIDAEVSPPPYGQSGGGTGVDWDAVKKTASTWLQKIMSKRPIR